MQQKTPPFTVGFLYKIRKVGLPFTRQNKLTLETSINPLRKGTNTINNSLNQIPLKKKLLITIYHTPLKSQ